jgi:molecular chaperone HtpG
MAKGKIGVTSENLFPIIKKFLYSDHDIFLREIVSNAVDATQKLKVLASKGEYTGDVSNAGVRVKLDKKAKTLTVSDEGIGMTGEEVKRFINQIAFSSANEFMEKYKDDVNAIILVWDFTLLSWFPPRWKSLPNHGRKERRLSNGVARVIRNMS